MGRFHPCIQHASQITVGGYRLRARRNTSDEQGQSLIDEAQRGLLSFPRGGEVKHAERKEEGGDRGDVTVHVKVLAPVLFCLSEFTSYLGLGPDLSDLAMAAVRGVRLELHETSGPLEQWLNDLDRTAVNRLFRSIYTGARFESPWYLPCPWE